MTKKVWWWWINPLINIQCVSFLFRDNDGHLWMLTGFPVLFSSSYKLDSNDYHQCGVEGSSPHLWFRLNFFLNSVSTQVYDHNFPSEISVFKCGTLLKIMLNSVLKYIQYYNAALFVL